MTSADFPLPAPTVPESGRLRVVTIPHADPYMEAVLPQDVVRVRRGVDPSPWLDADYLTAHAEEVDVLHVHAGAGDVPLGNLACWAETVRRLGVPLVVTVHQLRDQAGSESAASLEAVLATAEVVLTLTPGAADEIAERYGRTAIVVAHPSVATADPERGSERGLVGLRLGSDGNVPAPMPLVRAALSGAVSGGGRLRVLVSSGHQGVVPAELRALADTGELELSEYRPEEWAAQLQELHVAVLPEPCGTHSRDVEICRDVGTRVVAPGCSWFPDQWADVVTYGKDETGSVDGVSLTAAVGAALARPMPRPADPAWRREQRDAVRRVHADVYAQVAADRRWA